MEPRYYINGCTVHKVKKIENYFECDDEYILYNPYKHCWIIINSFANEIIDVVKELCSYLKIKSYFQEKYKADKDFKFSEVEDFLNYLLQKGFLSHEEFIPPMWTEIKPDYNDISMYKFHEIYISLNDKCNLNCIYCFNKDKRRKRVVDFQGRELDKEKIYAILQEFKELNGETVVFTGGEPTLYKDFMELLQLISKIGLKIQIITNGTTLSGLKIDDFIDYLDVINISIDSFIEEEVKELWEKEEAKKEIDNLIQGLIKLKKTIDKSCSHTKINIMPVVTKINYDSLTCLVHDLNDFFDRKISWKFTAYGDIGVKEIDERLRISEKEFYQLLFVLAKEIDMTNNLRAQQSFAINYGNTRRLFPYPRLISCTPSFFITASGNVYPCQGMECEEYYLGNIFQKSLRELFYEERFLNLRKRLLLIEESECSSCELRYVCTERSSFCKLENKRESGCKDMVIRRMYLKIKGY